VKFTVCSVAGLLMALFFSNGWAQKPATQTSDERLKKLEQDSSLHQLLIESQSRRSRNSYAPLDCDTKKFGTVQTDDATHLLILVACESIEPYLEGYRVVLDVGNPYFMSLPRVAGRLFFGPLTYPRRSVEISLPQGLGPGRWTRTTVNVSPAVAADMRSLQADFQVEQVSLSR